MRYLTSIRAEAAGHTLSFREMKAQKEEASKNIAATSNGVQEVVDIMKTNVESVLERGIKMAELGDRVNALEQGASQFELNGGKLKQKNFIKDKVRVALYKKVQRRMGKRERIRNRIATRVSIPKNIELQSIHPPTLERTFCTPTAIHSRLAVPPNLTTLSYSAGR